MFCLPDFPGETLSHREIGSRVSAATAAPQQNFPKKIH